MRCAPLYASLLLVAATTFAAESRRPNIVMMFADDLRHDAVGYAGNPHLQTPHLDRLARNGLVFGNCFVNTSICAVSRANLLSGQYPGCHGVDNFHKVFSPAQLRDTVPARLQRAGYQTAFFGKMGHRQQSTQNAPGGGGLRLLGGAADADLLLPRARLPLRDVQRF